MESYHYDIDLPQFRDNDNYSDWYKNVDIGGFTFALVEAAKSLGIKGRCLDIGCGTGYFLFELKKVLDVEPIGVDLHNNFIQKANQKAKSLNLSIVFKNEEANNFIDKCKDKFNFVTGMSIGEALGTMTETIGKLRSVTLTNKYYAIGWTEKEKESNLLIDTLTKYAQKEFYDNVKITKIEEDYFDPSKDIERVENLITNKKNENSDLVFKWGNERISSLKRMKPEKYLSVILIFQKSNSK